MAKKSEATAKFDRLEILFSIDLSKSSNKAIWNFISDMSEVIEADIKCAGYEREKRRSDTMKFLKAVKTYENVGIEALNISSRALYDLAQNCLKEFKHSKPLKVEMQKDGSLKVDGDKDEEDAFCEMLIMRQAPVMKKALHLTNQYLSSKVSSLKSEFEDFKKALDRQNKRRGLGHISKFCNEDAIRTLGKAPGVLENYRKLLSERISGIINNNLDLEVTFS